MFRSSGISSNSPIAFCWLTSMHDPDWGSFVQRILCPVRSHHSSLLNQLGIFPSLAGTRCSISVPPFTKRSSTKRSIILATVFPVAGLLAMGSIIFSHAASASHRTRGLIVMLPVSFHCLEYQLAWEPCHNYTVLCQGCSTSVEEHRSYAGFFNLAAIFGG